MSRWFQYVESVRRLLREWSMRYVLLQYINIQLGSLQDKGAKLLASQNIVKFQKKADTEDIEKSTTAQDREEVRKVRSACKNTAMFSTIMLAQKDLYVVNAIVVGAGTPVRKFHTDQNTENRSSTESVDWWCARAWDKGLPPLVAVFANLDSVCVMDSIGLVHNTSGLRDYGIGLASDDPRALYQDDVMTNFGDFALSLVCRRAKSALMSYDSYPTRFLLLGLEGGEAWVGRVKQSFDDYQTIKNIGGD
eukprot:9148115-Pyramimonas_sp.AAC.1